VCAGRDCSEPSKCLSANLEAHVVVVGVVEALLLPQPRFGVFNFLEFEEDDEEELEEEEG